MELKLITGQKGKTLLEFYSQEKWPSNWGDMPKMMTELINQLYETDHPTIWVFTSHAELLFTNEDDYQHWQVLVTVVKMSNQYLYKITAAQESPWHHLTGFADNAASATKLIISGLSVATIGKSRNIFLDSD